MFPALILTCLFFIISYFRLPFLAEWLPLQVWERARHHIVFMQTALSSMTRSEYGSGTAQMLGQYPELHNAGVMELYVRSELGSELL